MTPNSPFHVKLFLIVAQEEEDEENIEFDETTKLQVVNIIPPMTVDQVCVKLVES